MKKAFKSLSVLALLLCVVSCQISSIDAGVNTPGFKVTAAALSTADASRVTYEVDNTLDNPSINLSWAVGDQIIGFDDLGVSFTFTVESLSEGLATLNTDGYVPGEARKLYALFAPGYGVSDFVDGKLTVDLREQSGELNAETRVLLSSVADIEEGGAQLTFEHRSAVVGLKKFKISDGAALTVTAMELLGAPAAGTFSVKEGNWVLDAAASTDRVALSGNWQTDAEGVCTSAVYFVVLPATDAHLLLNAHASSGEYANLAEIQSLDVKAGYYHHMTRILGEAEASVGGVLYGTVAEAFSAANRTNTPVTIQLLKDCEATAPLSLNNAANPLYTLDLNGKTLTLPTANVMAVSAAKLRLTDSSSDDPAKQGTLTTVSGNSTAYILSVSNEGSLTMDGGNIAATAYRALYFTSSASGQLSGGTITANDAIGVAVGTSGGNVTFCDDIVVDVKGNNAVYFWGGNGTITGGSFTNTKASALIYANNSAVVNISGGLFNTPNVNTAAVSGNDARIYVTGGCHHTAVRDIYTKDKEGTDYVNVLNPDPATAGTYLYQVVSGSIVASVVSGTNSWNHGEILSAGTQADKRAKSTAASTLILRSDLQAASSFRFEGAHSYEITVNLNGHSLVSTASPALWADCSLTILDENNEGSISTTGDVAVSITAGTLTLSGGEFVAGTSAAAVSGTATMNVIGGYFYGGETDLAKTEDATVAVYGGYFRNTVPETFLGEGCAATGVSEEHNGKNYTQKVAGALSVASVNGVNYATLDAAITAAKTYAGEEDTVKLTLLKDFSDVEPMELTHTAKPIVLDLNGCTLAATKAQLITTKNKLTITDSAVEKGKITSTASQIIYQKNRNTSITLENCVLVSTKSEGSSWNKDAVVYFNTDGYNTAILNIVGAKIYATKKLTVLSAYYGVVTITDSELCSGTQSTGWYAILSALADLTFNSGVSYTSGTGNASTMHLADSGGKITVNGGYFYSGGRSVSAGNSSYIAKVTLNGGYLNKEPATPSGGGSVSYGEGVSLQPLDPAVTHNVEVLGQSLSFGYQVK